MCFYISQAKLILDLYPEIYNLIINDKIVKTQGGFGTMDGLSKQDVADGISDGAGCLLDIGPLDFTVKNIIELFKTEVEVGSITPETYIKIKNVLKDDRLPPITKENMMKWLNDNPPTNLPPNYRNFYREQELYQINNMGNPNAMSLNDWRDKYMKKYNIQRPTNESAMGCCCNQDVENFSDDVRNTTIGELLLQVKGNDDDLYIKLVSWLREHYQEFNNELEGSPVENIASLDNGVIGNIMQTMKSGMGLGGGESITTRGPGISRGHGLGPCGHGDRMGPGRGIAMIRIRKESKKTKKCPDTKLMIEAFKDLKKNNLI